ERPRRVRPDSPGRCSPGRARHGRARCSRRRRRARPGEPGAGGGRDARWARRPHPARAHRLHAGAAGGGRRAPFPGRGGAGGGGAHGHGGAVPHLWHRGGRVRAPPELRPPPAARLDFPRGRPGLGGGGVRDAGERSDRGVPLSTPRRGGVGGRRHAGALRLGCAQPRPAPPHRVRPGDAGPAHGPPPLLRDPRDVGRRPPARRRARRRRPGPGCPPRDRRPPAGPRLRPALRLRRDGLLGTGDAPRLARAPDASAPPEEGVLRGRGRARKRFSRNLL
ncbi:MAG: hypothetical protein AVDCRST_MAG68-5329, partial [uncultured Gemmatimonadetes bacterium]